MVRSHRRKISIALAGLIALGIAGYLSWRPPSAPVEQAPPDETEPLTAESLSGPEPRALESAETGLIDPPFNSPGARPLGRTETQRLQQVVAAQEPFPHDVMMDDYKRELWDEIAANPPEMLRPGDPALDADLAYRLYMYFGNCSIAPRTAQHVDRHLERITNRAEHATEEMLARLESNANEILDIYELCLLIPPEVDCRMEAVTWMSEAVRLGHEIAQVQFYEKAMGFILRPDRWSDTPPLVMLHPGLIEEFKATARYALSRAMEKGHPEAYLAMSEAYNDGVIYPKNPVLAFAYLRVAEIQAGKHQVILDRIGYHKSTLAGSLDQVQLAEAERLAMELRLEGRG